MGGIQTRHAAGVRWDSVVTTQPIQEPITTAQMKTHLRYSGSDANEEAYIDRLTTAARMLVEQQTGRTFYQKAITLYLDRWPADGVILLPEPPIISVTSVKYYDTDDVQQTISGSNYRVATQSEPGRVRPVDTYAWPSADARDGAIEVAYLAGYPTSGDGPADLAAERAESIEAIYLLVGSWYRNREAVSERLQYALPMGIDALTANDRCRPELMEAMQ